MILIYHNPNSKLLEKSLEVLETSVHNQNDIKYNDKPLDEVKLKKILNLLKIKPLDLIRTECNLWKNYYKKHLSNNLYNDADLIKLMIENHELIERPIIINGKSAIIGKPPKRIVTIQ